MWVTVVVYQLNRLLVPTKARISLKSWGFGQVLLGCCRTIQTIFGRTSITLTRFWSWVNVVILLADHLNLARKLVMSKGAILVLHVLKIDILPANCLINILICTCGVNALPKDVCRLENLLLAIYISVGPYVLLIDGTIEIWLIVANVYGVIFLFATHLMVHVHLAAYCLR